MQKVKYVLEFLNEGGQAEESKVPMTEVMATLVCEEVRRLVRLYKLNMQVGVTVWVEAPKIGGSGWGEALRRTKVIPIHKSGGGFLKDWGETPLPLAQVDDDDDVPF